MSQPGRAPSYQVLAPMPVVAEAPTLPTRFGALALDPDRIIMFPRGLLGFADQHHYVLADIPGNDAVFKLLQSIDDVDLSFVVLPLDRSEGPIAGADLVAARAALAIEDAALAVLAIVTLRADAARGRLHRQSARAAADRHRPPPRLPARARQRRLFAAPSATPRRRRSCRLRGTGCTGTAPQRSWRI